MRLFKPDFVLLLCPAAMSGGPEAIHQLAQIINELGVRAEILYGGADFEISKGRLKFDPVANNPLIAEYARYAPITVRRVTLTEQSIVILPEMYAGWHEMFAPAIPAYWWLSWDNAFDPRAASMIQHNKPNSSAIAAYCT
jgi:hypothetical protein